jgi:hypothetical protein
MGPRPSANRYWRGRLPSHQRGPKQTSSAVTGEVLGEVRGDRAGRTPHASPLPAQNFTTRASLAKELWIGTLRRVPFWSVRRSIR